MYNAPRKRHVKCNMYNVHVKLQKGKEGPVESAVESALVWRSVGTSGLLNANIVRKYYLDQGYTAVVICSITKVFPRSWNNQ